MRKQPLHDSVNFGAWLEGLFFFVLAIVLFSCYQNFLNTPNLSLIFDSQGYLAVANACQKLLSWEFLSAVFSYAGSGFSETARLQILNKLGGAFDLAFSGPIVPLFLSLVYNILGKEATTQNWLIGANAFLAISALLVPLIWLSAKQFWGLGQARLAAIIALTYPPLAINSWRILGDVTTCVAAALLIVLLSGLIMNRSFGIAAFLWGLFTGITIVLLMLGKAPLMPLPWILLAEIYSLAIMLKVPGVFNIQYLMGIFLGCALALAPWMLVKQIITGQPSIIVDRGGSYNLWVGCSLPADGWDVLPSRYVTHPKEFTKTTNEVRSEILTDFKEKPLSFLDLMARKPSRLMCAPWNDFQNSFFGINWVIQKWWQQVILLLAAAGALASLRVAVVRSDFKELAPVIILSTFVLYFLVYSPVISMSRYFYPAVPALLLLAAQGMFWLLSHLRKPAFQLLLLVTLLLPVVFILLDPSVVVNSLWLGRQVAQYGVGNVALFGSTVIVIGLSLWFWMATLAVGKLARLEPLSAVIEKKEPRYLIVWLTARLAPLIVLLGVLVCASASSRKELFCLEWAKQLTGRKSIESKIFIPRQAVSINWYLVVDAIGTGENVGSNRHPVLNVQVNGKDVVGQLRPLWAVDCSQRDNLVYLKAFAYGQGRNVEDIRQWWCIPVATDLIRENSNNVISLMSSGEKETRPIVFGDFVTPEGEPGGHRLSLRNFSWCKGFFADCVGEMRMDSIVKPRGLTSIWFRAPKIRPRIRLLAVEEGSLSLPVSSSIFTLASASVGSRKEFIADESVSPSVLADLNRQSRNLPGPSAALIEVSVKYKSAKGNKASVCLVENLEEVIGDTSARQFAPCAPTVLKPAEQWQTLSFDDILPLANNRHDQPAKLSKLRVLLSGVPWWDLLSYGRYKTKNIVDFEDLTIRLKPIKVINLDSQKWDEYQSQVLN